MTQQEQFAQFMNIPAELRRSNWDHKRWILWRKEVDSETGKTNKPPVNPNALHYNASKTDPNTWDFHHIVLRKLKGNPTLAHGIGYITGKTDFFIDIDHAYHEEQLKPEVAWIVNHVPCYWEKSQSGTGLHGYGLIDDATWQTTTRKNSSTGTGLEIYLGANNPQPIYFTGDVISQERELINCTQQVKEVYYKYLHSEPIHVERPQSTVVAEHSHETIIQLASEAINGDKFKKLYNAEPDYLSEYNGDDSAADMALISLLKFYTGPDNMELCLDILRDCPLWRPKWDKNKTYLSRTWENCTPTEYYNWPANPHILAGISKPITKSEQELNDYEPDDEPPIITVTPAVAAVPTDLKPIPPLFLTWNDLTQELKRPIQWCIEDYVEQGSFCMMGGASYSGKSMIAPSLVKSLCCGTDFGPFRTTQQPVVVLDYENGLRHAARNYGVLLDTPEEREQFQHYFNRYNHDARMQAGQDKVQTIDDKLGLIELLITSANKKYGTNKGTLFIDTLRGVVNLDDRELEQAMPTMYGLRALANSLNWTIIPLHHHQKNKNQYSGSMAMIGALTHVWSVEKNEQRQETYLRVEESRDGKKTGLVFGYEKNIQLSDYFDPTEYTITGESWHRLIYKCPLDQLDKEIHNIQAQTDMTHIIKHLQVNPLSCPTQILKNLTNQPIPSLDGKSPTMTRIRIQTAIEWGKQNGWLELQKNSANPRGFLVIPTKKGISGSSMGSVKNIFTETWKPRETMPGLEL